MSPSLNALESDMPSNIKKQATLLFTAIAMVGLAACGDGKPSESDAKKAVAAKFEGCKYISLTDFKRLGEPAQGNKENLYVVQATYELTLKLEKEQVDRLKADQMGVRTEIQRACPQVADDKIYTLITRGGDGSGKSSFTFDHQNMWLVKNDAGWQLRDGL